MSLAPGEIQYYLRQYGLDAVGVAGQLALKNARLVVVGAGGLGCPLLLYLASAGVGHITIIDSDRVELHNLHRQILYTVKDLGEPKAEVAKRQIQLHNPYIGVEAVATRLEPENAYALLRASDLVCDGSDNFETRYAVNDACLNLKIPFVSGAVFQFEGQVSVFNFKGGPSYRDLFPQPPPQDAATCNLSGVMGTTTAVIGSIMSNEAIKIICNLGQTLSGSLWQMNLLTMETSQIKIKPST